jgi:hypothetical protein
VQFAHDTSATPETLWDEFASEHATIPVLAERYGVSERTIRRRLNAYEIQERTPAPRTMVAIIDATRVGYSWMLVVRDPHAKENVYAQEISSETTCAYQMARNDLYSNGFSFSAIVCDGRFAAVPWLFPKIPVQMCHFHQQQIVIRYLTLNPKLSAGVALLDIVRTLPRIDESSFTDTFTLWCRTWHSFLQEKTVELETGRWHWTHKRVRQARDSITAHLPYLFTFQRFPHLKIPNTTNSLDGSFKKAKMAIGVHSGLAHARQIKLVLSLLFRDE